MKSTFQRQSLSVLPRLALTLAISHFLWKPSIARLVNAQIIDRVPPSVGALVLGDTYVDGVAVAFESGALFHEFLRLGLS